MGGVVMMLKLNFRSEATDPVYMYFYIMKIVANSAVTFIL